EPTGSDMAKAQKKAGQTRARAASKTLARSTPYSETADKKNGREGSPAHSPDTVIVGVGASAGGIEACGQLLQSIPPSRGLSFVIVQHLDPDHESMLTQILARHSRLPVRTITANEQKIEANHV